MDAENSGAAPHSGDVKSLDIISYLVFVDDNGGEGGRGAETAAVYD